MTRIVRCCALIVPSLALPLALSACDPPRWARGGADTDSRDPMARRDADFRRTETQRVAQDIARTEESVRLSIAEKRIEALEKSLAEMQTTPETVEIDLLKGRLAAVEAKAYALQDAPPSAPPVAAGTTTPRRAASTDATTTRRDPSRPPLRLPQLESAPRRATEAEKAAFNANRR
jgi:hypothetical protein